LDAFIILTLLVAEPNEVKTVSNLNVSTENNKFSEGAEYISSSRQLVRKRDGKNSRIKTNRPKK